MLFTGRGYQGWGNSKGTTPTEQYMGDDGALFYAHTYLEIGEVVVRGRAPRVELVGPALAL